MPLELDLRQKQKIRRRRFGVNDPYASYSAFDSFTRSDSSTSLGSATEKGGAWTVLQGTGGITSNKGYGVTSDMRAKLGAMTGGNGTVQCTVSSADWLNNPVGILFRLTDTNNQLVYVINGTASGSIRERTAGTLTSFAGRAPSPTLVNGNSYVFTIVCSGTSVTVFQDGVQLGGVVTLTGNAAAQTGTACGIWNWSTAGTGQTFDNFSVTL